MEGLLREAATYCAWGPHEIWPVLLPHKSLSDKAMAQTESEISAKITAKM